MIGPPLRRALHQALDLVLDAIDDEQRGAPKKVKRAVREPEIDTSDLTQEDYARAEKALAKHGWRKAKP